MSVTHNRFGAHPDGELAVKPIEVWPAHLEYGCQALAATAIAVKVLWWR
jgi:hypothetical protein